MAHNRLFNHCLICAFIVVMGLGLAFALPWLAQASSFAAQSEAAAKPDAPEAVPRYYVAKTGDGSDPTAGWPTAFNKLQDALAAVVETDGGVIWVTTGVYTPGTNLDDSFELYPGVEIYGGFDTSDTQFSERDWETNVTVLSGDIDGDDTTNVDGVVMTTIDIVGDNAYHVVTADGTTGVPVTESTVIDGFTITAGQANGNYPNYYGGGFYCDGSGSGNECSPSLANGIFYGNSALTNGGAMYNDGHDGGVSNPTLTNVTFSGNSSCSQGGAMFNNGADGGSSSPRLNNATFSGNSTGYDGGAMYNDGELGASSPRLTNVIFSGNSAAEHGGAMYNYGYEGGKSSPSLVNTVFSGNHADRYGGAMYNFAGKPIAIPRVYNITSSRGEIFDSSSESTSTPRLTNVTFSGNSAGELGGAVYNYGGEGTCNPHVRNTILWNNEDSTGTDTISSTIYNLTATIALSNSLIQGAGASGGSTWIGGSYIDGGGNIDTDPMFVTPIEPSTAPTTTGNLRLKLGSPAIDDGHNDYVDVSFDLDDLPRITDGDGDFVETVDMGAYETPVFDYLEIFGPVIFR